MNPTQTTEAGNNLGTVDRSPTSTHAANPYSALNTLFSTLKADNVKAQLSQSAITPSLRTDVAGSVFKMVAGVISVGSGLGNYVWFNAELSNGFQLGEAATLGSIFCAMWAFCGRTPALATAALATGSAAAVKYLNLDHFGLYPDQALSFFTSVALCWTLWQFQEELQRVSYESQDLDDPFKSGTSVTGLFSAYFKCLLGSRTELDHIRQQLNTNISKKLILGTLNASYLLCVSIISTIGGFFDPMLGLFAENEERQKVAKELRAKTQEHTDGLADETYRSIVRNYLGAMADEASGSLSSGAAGKGPNYFEKAKQLAELIGVQTSDLDLGKSAGQLALETRLEQSTSTVNQNSPLYQQIQMALNQSNYTKHVTTAADNLDATGGISTFFHSPEQKAAYVANLVATALTGINQSDSAFEKARMEINSRIKDQFQQLETQAAAGGKVVLPVLNFPEPKVIEISVPEFKIPTLNQKWNAWVEKFGGGNTGRSIAALCLAANVITAASFEIILPILNINWISISNRFRQRIRNFVDGIISLCGNAIANNAELETYNDVTSKKIKVGYIWETRIFLRKILDSLRPDLLNIKDYKSPDHDNPRIRVKNNSQETVIHYQSLASAVLSWFYGDQENGVPGLTFFQRIAMGRAALAGQVQNKVAQSLISIMARDLQQLSTRFGADPEVQSRYTNLLLLSVARIADKRDSSLTSRLTEFFLKAEAPDKTLVGYQRANSNPDKEPVSVRLQLKYYQVIALWNAWDKTRGLIIKGDTNAIKNMLMPVAKSWTDFEQMPLNMGPIASKVYFCQIARVICGLHPKQEIERKILI